MTKKDYIKFATLLKTLKVRFDNKDFTLKFNDVYSGMIEIFKSDTEARHWYINHLDLSKNWLTLKGSIMNKILNK